MESEKDDGFFKVYSDLAKNNNNETTELKKGNVRVVMEEGDDGFFAIFAFGKKGLYHFQYYPSSNHFEVDVTNKKLTVGNRKKLTLSKDFKEDLKDAKKEGRCHICRSSLEKNMCPNHGKIFDD